MFGRRKRREQWERDEDVVRAQLEYKAAAERDKERTALRRRGYLTADNHFPWRVPDDLLDLYSKRYPDLNADRTEGRGVTVTFTDVEERAKARAINGPAKKPARKRTTKAAAKKATTT